ncbi:MAG: ABC transporter permease subunit [Candidatus Marinimicrobia bacterium]|nr:ABC transporter permease subunit [Candidatus Neomarinimicrobiota bacterium]
MLGLIQNELIKIFSKYRTYISFAAILILLPLVLWGFSYGGGRLQEEVMDQFKDSFILVGTLFNGFLATYITMNFLWVHIPFLIALVAGDVVAGEGAGGTFRIYLTRPVSRFKILISKLIATYLFTLAVVVFFIIMSLGLGTVWLGGGDLIVMHEGIIIYSSGEALLRFILGFGFALVNLLVVASLCFMLSTFVNNAIGPMIGAMSVIMVGLAISNIPLAIFERIQPWFFTSYFDIWKQAFYDPIPWNDISFSLLVLLSHTTVFVVISLITFVRKDILT